MFCIELLHNRKCPICGDKANIHSLGEVDYDLLCNMPKRELLPDEIIDYSQLAKEFDKNFVLIDTRGKDKFEQIKSIATHIPLFEIKNSIDQIKKLSEENKLGKLIKTVVICLAYNENDAKYGAMTLSTLEYKSVFVLSSRY